MSEYAVRVRNLNVRFGDFYAVKDVSFEVRKGEVFGFLGANGAGKTTTIRVLCGLLTATSGEVVISGNRFERAGVELKKKVGYMSQKFTLYDDLTVGENLRLNADLHRMDPAWASSRTEELLEFIGWSRSLDLMVKDLPGGQKQQVSLVAAMMHDPEILFLDEPTAGVSPHARARFWELIRKIADGGKTVFVTTHYMDEAEQCGRIALMRNGELVALDSPARLKAATFPRGLVELTPESTLTQAQVAGLRDSGLFRLLEPHGLRYHGEWRDWLSETEGEKRLSAMKVAIRGIPPSLEDVFIRIVEGGPA